MLCHLVEYLKENGQDSSLTSLKKKEKNCIKWSKAHNASSIRTIPNRKVNSKSTLKGHAESVF